MSPQAEEKFRRQIRRFQSIDQKFVFFQTRMESTELWAPGSTFNDLKKEQIFQNAQLKSLKSILGLYFNPKPLIFIQPLVFNDYKAKKEQKTLCFLSG